MSRVKTYLTYSVAGLACFSGLSALAQDTGGLTASLDVSQRLEYSDNFDLDVFSNPGFRATTELGFSLASETRIQRLAFFAGGQIEFGSDNESANAFADPLVRLSYARAAKNAALTLDASYQQTEINSTFTEELFGAQFVLFDTGERANFGLRANLDFGLTDPVGGSLTYSFNQVDYTDTANPDLRDATTNQLEGRVNFRIDPRLTARLTAGYIEVDEDGGQFRETTRLGVGVEADVTKTLTVDAAVNYTNVDVEGGEGSDNEGIGFDVDLVQDRPNGNITAGLSSDIDQNGRRTSLRFGRNLEMKAGSLGFSLGLSQRDDGDIRPLYRLDYERQLSEDAAVRAELTQSFDTDTDGTEALNTGFNLAYQQPLTKVSDISMAFNFRDTNIIDDDEGDDASRLSLGITYRHDITRNWDLAAGYSRSLTLTEGDTVLEANTVFVGLERTFDFRP